MEVRENNKTSYSHTYIENDISQLLEKMLYAIKNRRRRSILKALDELETMSISDVRKYLQKKVFAGKSGASTIRSSYLEPWIETGAIERKDRKLYKITSLGKKLSKVIGSQKEFDLLKKPGHRGLSTELILLELRDRKKRYQELKAKLGLSDPWKVVKKLKDEGFLKVNHPKDLLHVSHLFYFGISPYLPFIEGIKNYIEKTGRSWFTEYSIITHLNLKWKDVFGRPMEIKEAQELLKKGIDAGGIIKTNGSYEVSIENLTAPIENLTSSEKKILTLIKEGYVSASMIAEKSGLHFASVHKILTKLEKKDLVEKYVEDVTMELTEKGKRIADCLFKIKECVVQEIGW